MNGCNLAKVLLAGETNKCCNVCSFAEKKRKEGNVMTRILLIVTTLALVATTAFADVTISLEKVGERVGNIQKVRVGYDANEPIRAFGLDLYTSGGGDIYEIDDYNVGDNNGYGIFPGRFREAGIDPADPNWATENYNPTAAGGDPDRQPGLGYYGITVEMGSLYTTGNEPSQVGTLFTIDVNMVDDNDIPITDCNLCVTINTTRGGVVNEDAEEVAVILPPGGDGAPADCIKLGEGECFPSTDPNYPQWVAFGKPDCWCNPRQCHGDAGGTPNPEGSAKAGYFYVGYEDLNTLIPAWQVKEPPKGPGIATVTSPSTGIAGICADFSHDQEGSAKAGYFRVGYRDLNILIASWQVKEAPKGPGIPTDCPD
jgi:hypothetical protein